MWCWSLTPTSNCNHGIAGGDSYEICAEITGIVWLGSDDSVPAGVDTVSVWHGPCQHWWQFGLTSSQNQPESFPASVTSSVCGEFVMGDCLSGSINRHHCAPPSPPHLPNSGISSLWCKYSLSTWRKSIFPHTDPTLTHLEKTRETCSSQERLGSGGRAEQTDMTFFLGSALP